MRLTARARYTVTAMLDIALHAQQGPIALAEIAQRQGISQTYLEQLFRRLRQKGLVVSARGPAGGYSLNREANAITVGMIINAIDKGVDTTRCLGKARCQGGARCLTHELWSALNYQIDHFLNHITLEALTHQRAVKQVAQRQDSQTACTQTLAPLISSA